MKTFHIQGQSGTSIIQVGPVLAEIEEWLPLPRTVIVTDGPVYRLHGSRLPACPVIEIGTGEAVKTLETVAAVHRRLLALEADRGTFLLVVGGGLVCDVGGFVASTYMRGIRFALVATTLLAQVDASVGGKNGVNLDGYKNIVGVFNQPERVVCDPSLLATLPPKALGCGFAEIIKHAAIADADLFAFLEHHRTAALALDPTAITRLVYDSVRIKSEIVNRDERESGERRKLNFGHTFGHAVEKVLGVPHGEAVSRGMAVAARLSVARGRLHPAACERLLALIRSYRLPVDIGGDREALIQALARDKKRDGEQIHFVLLEDLGRAVVEPVSIDELQDVLHQAESECP
jgi:3-dehydroquinate synthase